jgi:hypothetical protein
MSASDALPARRRIFTFEEAVSLPQYRGLFTVGSLRRMRFSASRPDSPYTGFNACVVRLGRRVLLDIDRFEDWLASRRSEG